MPKPNIVELNKDTPSVQYLCKKCKRLAKVIEMVLSARIGETILVRPINNEYAVKLLEEKQH